MGYASKDIRNILVAGHAGCGKTTLTEALLYMSGASERMGRVEDGTTASDFDPEEIRRKASLNSSVVPVEFEGVKYNLIDAPGLFDFETGAAEGIMAAESVLICVSGRSGVTVGAEKAYQLALKNNKARMIFVTKADLENADYFKILEQMKIKFGPSVCPCVVPVRLDDGTVAYIDLFSQKAFKYEGGKQVQIDLPDIGHRFEGLIQAMSEAIAETDEALMEKFFEGEAFTTEEIVQGMASGVRSGQITPVFCGSAVNAQALDMLLYNMNVLLPGADTASAVGESGGEPVEITADPAAPLCAYVFKTVADPFVGKLSFIKVLSGRGVEQGRDVEVEHLHQLGQAAHQQHALAIHHRHQDQRERDQQQAERADHQQHRERPRHAARDHPVDRRIADVGEHRAHHEGGEDGAEQPEQGDEGRAGRGPGDGLQAIDAGRLHLK